LLRHLNLLGRLGGIPLVDYIILARLDNLFFLNYLVVEALRTLGYWGAPWRTLGILDNFEI
jgi:hypothetical protein